MSLPEEATAIEVLRDGASEERHKWCVGDGRQREHVFETEKIGVLNESEEERDLWRKDLACIWRRMPNTWPSPSTEFLCVGPR
jgi:hypothetical protein